MTIKYDKNEKFINIINIFIKYAKNKIVLNKKKNSRRIFKKSNRYLQYKK